MGLIEPPRPKVALFAILKVGRRDHLQQLAKGRLRFQSLEFYEDVEQRGKPCHDPDEGVTAVFSPRHYKIRIGQEGGPQHELTEEGGLVGSVIVKQDATLSLRVMCFHSIHSGSFRTFGESTSNNADGRRPIDIPETMSNFGDFAWVISDLRAFRDRLFKALGENALTLKSDLVRYHDFEAESGHFPFELKGLIKSHHFKNEREYRLIVPVPKGSPDPFYLDIGELEDISMLVPLETLRATSFLLSRTRGLNGE